MNGKSAIMLVLAVLSGLGAMYGTSQMLSKDGKVAPVQMQEMLVAARALKAEEILDEDMIKVIRVPKDRVQAGSFASAKDVLQRSIQIPILADEPILDAKLAPKGTPPGLVARIPAGMRAFAIEVNEQSGVSGFILPGHRVDVVQQRDHGSKDRAEAEVVLQNVPVLASGQTFTSPDDKSILSRTVTLALKPEQVETLVAARSRGPVSLSLRGINDHEIVDRPEPAEPVEMPEPVVAEVEPPPPPPEAVEPPPPPEPEPEPEVRHLTIVHGLHGSERHMIGGRRPTTSPEVIEAP